ncbi:hypothetical protein B0T26DRAFT_783103 [Lasiosphaeria miniovina]|uniref:Uncharacterized protein n=1 Tax=Lasiosphaeria miniovina TaxID=1954250 RepID=A0AA40ADJ5_9PEZI|nr:uncharacterized protein B0T26DRAFT_783103 [Lasiosphaeria miniovina]KAK0713713.1 hypothetical protein B0T26DRAFT_783103 [Lasiosphaeria miniovina]
MKLSVNIFVLLAAAATVYASPAIDARDVAASVSVHEGEFLFVGADRSTLEKRGLDVEARCSGFLPPHSDCDPGKCQCIGNNGCWSCNGGRMQCQPGPGSGQCWT